MLLSLPLLNHLTCLHFLWPWWFVVGFILVSSSRKHPVGLHRHCTIVLLPIPGNDGDHTCPRSTICDYLIAFSFLSLFIQIHTWFFGITMLNLALVTFVCGGYHPRANILYTVIALLYCFLSQAMTMMTEILHTHAPESVTLQFQLRFRFIIVRVLLTL